MIAEKNQIIEKHFQIWGPVQRFNHADIYGNAPNPPPKRPDKEFIQAAVLKFQPIQADGELEFRKCLGDACA